jgi:hypothetical protein
MLQAELRSPEFYCRFHLNSYPMGIRGKVEQERGCGSGGNDHSLPSSAEVSNDIATKQNKTKKQTPWPLVRERTIPTDRPPLVDEA